MLRLRLIAVASVVSALILTFGVQLPPADAHHGCCHTCLQAYYACASGCSIDPFCEQVCWNNYLACIPACAPRICPY
jgi:hypothetical protein